MGILRVATLEDEEVRVGNTVWVVTRIAILHSKVESWSWDQKSLNFREIQSV